MGDLVLMPRSRDGSCRYYNILVTGVLSLDYSAFKKDQDSNLCSDEFRFGVRTYTVFSYRETPLTRENRSAACSLARTLVLSNTKEQDYTCKC